MRTFGRILMAGCVAGLALTTAGLAAAGGTGYKLRVVTGGLPSGHARAATALEALSEAIGENSKGPAKPADIAAARTAIARAKSAVYGLGTEAASDFAAELELAMTKSGVMGTSFEKASGTVTWAQPQAKGLLVRLGLGNGSRGQPEVVIRAAREGTHPVIQISTGIFDAPRGATLTGRDLAEARHLKQTFVFSARGQERGARVAREPGHRSLGVHAAP